LPKPPIWLLTPFYPIGPIALGLLTSRVYADYAAPLNYRYAGVTMCAIFAIGLILLPFAPETKGKPLPE